MCKFRLLLRLRELDTGNDTTGTGPREGLAFNFKSGSASSDATRALVAALQGGSARHCQIPQ